MRGSEVRILSARFRQFNYEVCGRRLVKRSEVESFQPDSIGRPPKPPAGTTAKLNKAFREAKEAEEASQKKAAKKTGKK